MIMYRKWWFRKSDFRVGRDGDVTSQASERTPSGYQTSGAGKGVKTGFADIRHNEYEYYTC